MNSTRFFSKLVECCKMLLNYEDWCFLHNNVLNIVAQVGQMNSTLLFAAESKWSREMWNGIGSIV